MPEKPIRAMFVSSSFPISLQDWRSVFVRHQAEALGRHSGLDTAIWAPHGPCAGRIRQLPDARTRLLFTRLMQQGGIAHLLRTRPLVGCHTAIHLLASLRKACRRQTTDFYFVQWLQNALALPKDGKPLLVTALGTDMNLLQVPGMRFLLRRQFRSRPTIICPNASWMEPILQETFHDTARICLLPLGIDQMWFDVERRPVGEKWLVVSRITRGKLGTLLEWCEPLFRNTMRELHLIGPNQESLALPEWVQTHGPASPETLAGIHFPEASGLISLSQHSEGRPQVMLEAMAAGIPVVASDIPAHRDFLASGKTAMLVHDADSLADAIEKLEMPAFNAQIGNAGKAWAKEHAGTWDDYANRVVRLYQSLVKS